MTMHCDIFCNVVDNYGDAGVCWRLARQLALEHGVAVRLWVDDLATLQRLCPEVDLQMDRQRRRGVDVRHWTPDAFSRVPVPSEGATPPAADGAAQPDGAGGGQAHRGGTRHSASPAAMVIEAFACELPEPYVEAMAAREHKPVWLNLEYLSAEEWVEGCHKLQSPHPRLPLVKYFFFPGFTGGTGGLLLEHDLLARRDAFQGDPQAIAAFWQGLKVPPAAGDLRISLFCYENPALAGLLDAWEHGAQPVTCLVPEGRALPQIAAFFGSREAVAGESWQRGNLRVQVLPFVEQERYDLLLWACDVNFVRGEDSFVRAQWAGRPFIWHIYPQRDGVHMGKLRAFLARYGAGLPAEAAQALRGLWEAWNEGANPAESWNEFRACQSMLRQQSGAWAQALAGNNLALNLLDFFREVGKMRDFKI